MPEIPNPLLADDLMEGADPIAEFLFGDRTQRRKVYRWASEVNPEERLPTFRRGGIICGRKSTILRWIAEREQCSAKPRVL
jgi:hypothetical protein